MVGIFAAACGAASTGADTGEQTLLLDEDGQRVELVNAARVGEHTYWDVRWRDQNATDGAVSATEESPIRQTVAECATESLADDLDAFAATTLAWAIGPAMGTPERVRDAFGAIDRCGGLDDLRRAILVDFTLPADRECVAAQLGSLDGVLSVVDVSDPDLARADRIAAAAPFAQCLDLFVAVEDRLTANGLACLRRQDPSIETQFLVDAGTPELRRVFEGCLTEDEMRVIDGG